MGPIQLGYANANRKPKWSRKRKTLTGLALLALTFAGTNRAILRKSIGLNNITKIINYIPSWEYYEVPKWSVIPTTRIIDGTLPLGDHRWSANLEYSETRGFSFRKSYWNLSKPIKRPMLTSTSSLAIE